ncbi:hypothetical protein MC885_011336 [Smutsia gigantea]|nr:hypothetical protein MC885_011336 [Smutsia gigantea]
MSGHHSGNCQRHGGTWMRLSWLQEDFLGEGPEDPAIFWSIRDLIFSSCSERKPANQTQKPVIYSILYSDATG